MIIRFVRADDSAALLRIYAGYIDTPVTFECALPSDRAFAERIAAISAEYPYLVCEEEGAIVGYAYAHRQRAVSYTHLDVYKRQSISSASGMLAVEPSSRGSVSRVKGRSAVPLSAAGDACRQPARPLSSRTTVNHKTSCLFIAFSSLLSSIYQILKAGFPVKPAALVVYVALPAGSSHPEICIRCNCHVAVCIVFRIGIPYG